MSWSLLDQLDKDWRYFDAVRQVVLEIKNADETYGDPQTVDALDAAFEVSEEYRQDSAGDEGGQIFVNQTTLALRRSQVTGIITRGSRITDWDGKVRYVDKAISKSLDSRWMCVMQN